MDLLIHVSMKVCSRDVGDENIALLEIIYHCGDEYGVNFDGQGGDLFFRYFWSLLFLAISGLDH